ncbi:MAG TPA: DNA translocase FtsK, partial [Candidatus Dormibacteraeota bacterium]|nr:DNA translocase FtsK [Candidatus Dormibacteraeota bacterium]
GFRSLGLGAWLVGLLLAAVGVQELRGSRARRGLQGAGGAAMAGTAAVGLLALVRSGSGGWLGAHVGPPLVFRIGLPATVVLLVAVAVAGLVLAVEASPSRWGARALGIAGWLARSIAPPTPSGTERVHTGLGPVEGLESRPSQRLLERLASPVGAASPGRGGPPPAASDPLVTFERLFEGLDDQPAAATAATLLPVASASPVTPGAAPTTGPASGGEVPGAGVEDDEEPEPVWQLPGLELLDATTGKQARLREEIATRIKTIEATLQAFGVDATVVNFSAGPTVTQYELQPGPGVAVRKVVAYQTDLALALAAPIRIQAPIPGKSAIGVEVPNKAAQLVSLKEVVQTPSFATLGSRLAVALGADVSGHPVIGDLAKMPHLLIAGATGSGKSVCINAVLGGFLLQSSPKDLRLILVDPKRVELSNFGGLPHLLVPVVVEPDLAVAALRWAVTEMENRYKLFASNGARNIEAFNERAPGLGLRALPKIVIVIDELADLMMVSANEIEELICRIAQLARAVGIHLVVATQRPSADIITGLIKANIPSRVAFAVSSGVDSRVILDEMGAEKLLGRGDMLYLPIDAGKATRLQGAYVSDRELERLIGWWTAQGAPRYQEEILEATALSPGSRADAVRRDPLFGRAARVVATEGRAAASLLQRKLNVGYTRAARLVDQLADARVVGPYEGSKSRAVLMSLPDVDELLAQLAEEQQGPPPGGR